MAQQERRRILFVGGVAPHISEKTLFEHFSQFSELTKARIMREKKTRESKGYAYITVADSRSIPQIMSAQHLILGRKLDVQLATSKGEKRDWKVLQRCRRVYAVGLPPGTTNEQVAEVFQQFGEVRNAFVIREHESRIRREYAYIQFGDDYAAELALSSAIKINGKVIGCQPFGSRRKSKHTYKSSPETRPITHHPRDFQEAFKSPSQFLRPDWNALDKHQNSSLDFLKFPEENNVYSVKPYSNRLTYDSPSNYRFNILVAKPRTLRMN